VAGLPTEPLSGRRAAEEAGLVEELVAYIAAARHRAYLAGATGKPFKSILNSSHPRG